MNGPNNEEGQDRRGEILLEYELAQQSAEHHDTLLWEVTAIIWSANTLMLGFAFETSSSSPQGIVFAGAILGIFLSAFAHLHVRISGWVKRQKYAICHVIERELALSHRQHLEMLETYPLGHRRLAGIQTKVHLFLTICFILAWAYVAWHSFCLLSN